MSDARLVLLHRFTLPPFLTLKNFEGLDLGKMDEVSDNWDCTTLSLSLLWLQSRMNLQHPLHYGYALPPGEDTFCMHHLNEFFV